MGHEVLHPSSSRKLTETAHFLDELLNRAPDPRQPYVGKHAFAHKGGLHVAGVRADALDLRARRPRDGGQPAATCSSRELAGRGTVAEKAAAAGIGARTSAGGRAR